MDVFAKVQKPELIALGLRRKYERCIVLSLRHKTQTT